MYRITRLTVTAGAAALICACTSDGPQQPLSEPLRASFSDGAHSGNPDFFFLPPIFKNPGSLVTPGAFNARVRPTVEICELQDLQSGETERKCGATIKTFGAADIRLDVANEQYEVNWDTKAQVPALVTSKEYRISVFLGPHTRLGWVDVDPVATGAGLKRVDTNEFIGLVDGRTLPIKFRIENGAACEGGDCDSKTIDLSQGGFVVLATTGDRVDIPKQNNSSQVVTVTVQQCDGLNVDIPLFGNCLSVTADPPLGAALEPRATVSMCSISDFPLPPHPQDELITLHRQDGDAVLSLPHSSDFCATIGQAGTSNGPRSLVARGWRALRNTAAWLFEPTPLHARTTTMVLDVGAGGQTDGFSDFQFALPVALNAPDAGQLGTQIVGTGVAATLMVTDALGEPAAGATVRFNHSPPGEAEDGGVSSSSGLCRTGETDELVCTTDGSGAITVQWALSGATGENQLSAQTVGAGLHEDLDGNGPFDSCIPRPFGEDGEIRCAGTANVDLDLSEGVVTFSATGITAGLLLRYPFDGTADNSGQLAGFNGIATSVTYPAGKFGQAIKFDGTTATGAAFPRSAAVFGQGGSKWTISLWFKEDTKIPETLLWRFRGSIAGWETYHGVAEPGQRMITCSDGGCLSLFSDAGVWHSLVYRYDGASATVGAPVEIFVDGEPAGQIDNAGLIPLVSGGVTDIRMGNLGGILGPSQFYVDEFRVYNQVFSRAQQCTVVIGGTWDGETCTLP